MSMKWRFKVVSVDGGNVEGWLVSRNGMVMTGMIGEADAVECTASEATAVAKRLTKTRCKGQMVVCEQVGEA